MWTEAERHEHDRALGRKLHTARALVSVGDEMLVPTKRQVKRSKGKFNSFSFYSHNRQIIFIIRPHVHSKTPFELLRDIYRSPYL